MKRVQHALCSLCQQIPCAISIDIKILTLVEGGGGWREGGREGGRERGRERVGVCHSPVNFRIHSRAYPRSLPLTPVHSRSLPHVLMHEYLRENDKSRQIILTEAQSC